jgi:hypothetical protein
MKQIRNYSLGPVGRKHFHWRVGFGITHLQEVTADVFVSAALYLIF